MGEASKGRRITLDEAQKMYAQIVRDLENSPICPYIRIEAVGSLRRELPDMSDIDILIEVSPFTKDALLEKISCLSEKLLVGGEHNCQKMSTLIDGVQVDFNFCDDPDEWGSQMLHHTGSVAYNIRLRQLAIRKKLMLNQHGLWDGEVRMAGRTEEDVCEALKCRFRNPVGEREY